MAENEMRLLRIRDVMQKVGLSRPSVYKRMAIGNFPKPIYPAPRAPRWRSDEVDEWIAELSAARAA